MPRRYRPRRREPPPFASSLQQQTCCVFAGLALLLYVTVRHHGALARLPAAGGHLVDRRALARSQLAELALALRQPRLRVRQLLAQLALLRTAAFACPLDMMRCVAAACSHLGALLHLHDAAFVRLAALAILSARPPMLHSQVSEVRSAKLSLS